jgi:hypothetical protein
MNNNLKKQTAMARKWCKESISNGKQKILWDYNNKSMCVRVCVCVSTELLRERYKETFNDLIWYW